MTRCLLLLILLVLSSGQALSQPPTGPEIRNINANFTTNTIVADGVISPGEWDGAAGGGGEFRILREPAGTLDQDGHRFRVMWDDENLYILHETDYDSFEPRLFGANPGIDFSFENLNLYLDPNRDGDLNEVFGEPLDLANGQTTQNVDGYQLSFNTPHSSMLVSTDARRSEVGFFTEAHVNAPFGDAGNWNGGENPIAGPALDGGIVVAQSNSNTEGGLIEVMIPFAALDAEELAPTPETTADFDGDGVQDNADYSIWRDTLGDEVGGANNDLLDGADANDNGVVDQDDYQIWRDGFGRGDDVLVESGLNAVDGVTAGEVWGLQVAFIGDVGSNFLPVWNFTDTDFFATWPHGTLTFVGPSSGSIVTEIPEPGTMVLALAAGVVAMRRPARRSWPGST